MSKHVLKSISDSMGTLNINYAFGTYYKDPIVYPYFVGEYQETESISEDGLQESTFILTGFSRDSWLTLENAREKIEKHFKNGLVFMASDGSAAVISYAMSLTIPQEDAELKSIQINLTIKEWKVNN